jgi:hypothetical protein
LSNHDIIRLTLIRFVSRFEQRVRPVSVTGSSTFKGLPHRIFLMT